MGEPEIEFSEDLWIDEGGYGDPLIVQIHREPTRVWCRVFHDPIEEYTRGECYGARMSDLRKLNGMEAIAWAVK
jgi:hypothetical protein